MFNSSTDLQARIVPTEVFTENLLSNLFLRRHTDDFCSPHFVEHITQSLLTAVDIQFSTVILSSDGRYRCTEAMERAARVLAGNSPQVRRVLVERSSSLNAIASLLRARHCHFALVFTGGHHPAMDYLGLKVLSPPGIPMRKEVLEEANKISRSLESYRSCEDLNISFEEKGTMEYFVSNKPFTIEMVSSTPPYVEIMNRMFDFTLIKGYLEENSIALTVDCSNGVTGPIVVDIMRNIMEAPEISILNADTLEDFGNLPADPNPASRKDFLELINENKSDIGIVISPDGGRCLLVGEDGFVVSPSDTLAVIADQWKCIPFLRENPLKGMVFSICTSQACDKVAKYSSLLGFVVLPGWENFAAAMLPAANNSILFGEDSSAVGVSSCNYCSDKDAVWTLLAWLSILATTNRSIKEVVMEHWKIFGRNVTGRMDFENLPLASLESFITFFKDTYTLRFKKKKSENFGKVTYCDPLELDPSLRMAESQKNPEDMTFDIDNYVHPFGFVRKSLMRNDAFQVYQIRMTKVARVIIRRSESVHNATTLRFYIEVCLDAEDDKLFADRKEILQPYISAALKITKVREFFGENINPVIV